MRAVFARPRRVEGVRGNGERVPPRDAAAALAHEAYEAGKTIRELRLEKQVLPKEKLDALLDARKMTGR